MSAVVGSRHGRSIHIVQSDEHVGMPVMGFVVKDDMGYFAITDHDQIERRENFHDAVAYVESKWNARKDALVKPHV